MAKGTLSVPIALPAAVLINAQIGYPPVGAGAYNRSFHPVEAYYKRSALILNRNHGLAE